MGKKQQRQHFIALQKIKTIHEDVGERLLKVLKLVNDSNCYNSFKYRIFKEIIDFSKVCILQKPGESMTSTDYIIKIQKYIPKAIYNNEKTKVQMQTIEIEDDETLT